MISVSARILTRSVTCHIDRFTGNQAVDKGRSVGLNRAVVRSGRVLPSDHQRRGSDVACDARRVGKGVVAQHGASACAHGVTAHGHGNAIAHVLVSKGARRA